MDRVKHDDRREPDAAAEGGTGAKILKFPTRPPRLALTDFGSGWYHQAAIDTSDHGHEAKR